MTRSNRNSSVPTPERRSPSHPYRYFVSLSFRQHGAVAFTNLETSLPWRITSLEHVQILQRDFVRQGYVDACVLGFSLLRDDSNPRTRASR